jgi:hypothetical protein
MAFSFSNYISAQASSSLALGLKFLISNIVKKKKNEQSSVLISNIGHENSFKTSKGIDIE